MQSTVSEGNTCFLNIIIEDHAILMLQTYQGFIWCLQFQFYFLYLEIIGSRSSLEVKKIIHPK